jgi:hypothetical protein
MTMMSLLWMVWAGITVALLALLVYRGTLTRYEEDGMFLEDSAKHQHDEQDQILMRVRKIQPAVKAFAVGACAMSAAILGMYVYDAIRQFYL